MRKYLSIILLLLGFSSQLSAQMITAPNPLTIEANQSNVDAGDFVINWANTTDNILVSLNLDYHVGASISFPTTTGLTLNTGYTSWTNVTSIVFYGTKTNVNAALAAMTLSTGSMKTAVKIALEATLYDLNYKYNPVNKHFYQYISGNVAYATAKTNAGTYSFKGKTGYLATITSDSENNFINNNISGNNIWLALTDAASEGNWVIDAGPENGTLIKTSNGQLTGNLDGQYNNWCSGEPNDAGSNEDYAASKWNGGTCWNDLPSSYASVQGYIVEISADFPAGSGYTGVYSAYTVHNNDIAFSLASANTSNLSASTVSNFPNYFGGIQMNDGHTLTIGSGKTINTNKVLFQGSGKMILTDNTSKWTPGAANTSNTYVYSPNSNAATTYWKVSSTWVNDVFYENAPYPGAGSPFHFTPWINSPQGWSVGTNDANQYIILNTDVPMYIAGIVTQGRAYNGGQWVSSGKIESSLDGITFSTVIASASLNSNSSDAVTTYFPSVVYAKYIRVSPIGYINHMTMRLGLILKSNNVVADGLQVNLDASNPISYGGTGATWTDLSGNANHATLTASPTYNINNLGSFSFNGSTQSATSPAISSLSGNNSRTVIVWYKSTANQNTPLIDKGAITVDNAEQLFLVYTDGAGVAGSLPPTNPGGIAICFWGNDLYYPLASSTIFDGNWHFIAYTYDASTRGVKICFDGKFVSSTYYWDASWTTKSSSPFILNRSINTTNNSIYIGQTRATYWGKGSSFANATMPVVQMYNRVLSDSEILTNFSTQRGRYGR